MNKHLILAITLLIAVAGYIYWKPSPSPAPEEPVESAKVEGQIDPANATIYIEGEKVKLSQGKSDLEQESGLTEHIRIIGDKSYGDINGDAVDDVVFFVSQSGGGSGTFLHVAAFVSGNLGHKGTNAIFLGDRVAPQYISISKGEALVGYLDRRFDEPFAAEPTILTNKRLTMNGSELVER